MGALFHLCTSGWTWLRGGENRGGGNVYYGEAEFRFSDKMGEGVEERPRGRGGRKLNQKKKSGKKCFFDSSISSRKGPGKVRGIDGSSEENF